MPINPMYVQPLSFQQANPVLAGAQVGSDLVSNAYTNQLKNLQAQQLGIQNQILPQSLQAQLQSLQTTNQYLPQTLQSDIGLKNAQAGEAGSQSNYLNAQTQFLPFNALANLDPVTRMIYSRILAPRLNGNIQQNPQLTSGNGGMTVQPSSGQESSTPPMMTGVNYTDSNPVAAQLPIVGNYQTLPAGLNAAQGQQVLQKLNSVTQPTQNSGIGMPDINNLYGIQMRNLMTQMGKDPSMGSTRAGAGGTYINPYTGQTTSTDTSPNTTLDQRTSAAIQRVTPLLNDMAQNLAPFRNAEGQSILGLDKVWNYLTPNSWPKSSSPNMSAQGESDLQVVPESILRAFGLPATNESLERMQAAIEPRFGETSDGYKNRITNYLTGELAKYQAQANARLKSGMNIDPSDPGTQASAQDQTSDPLGIR